MLLLFYNVIIMLLSYMILILLLIPTEYEAGEVGIGRVDMAFGEKMVGVKRARTSRYYIAGMLDGDIIFIKICL